MQHSMNSFFITHGIGELHIFNYFGMIWYLRLLTTFPPPRAQAMADFAELIDHLRMRNAVMHRTRATRVADEPALCGTSASVGNL